MNHAITINPDKTLVITVPEGTEVDRVKIRQMNTQKSKLYWRDEVLDQYKWERDIAIQQLKELGYGFGQEPKTDGDTISRQAAIDAALTFFVEFLGGAFHEDDQRKLIALYEQLPSVQARETECKKCYWSDERGCSIFCRAWNRYTAHGGYCHQYADRRGEEDE